MPLLNCAGQILRDGLKVKIYMKGKQFLRTGLLHLEKPASLCHVNDNLIGYLNAQN